MIAMKVIIIDVRVTATKNKHSVFDNNSTMTPTGGRRKALGIQATPSTSANTIFKKVIEAVISAKNIQTAFIVNT